MRHDRDSTRRRGSAVFVFLLSKTNSFSGAPSPLPSFTTITLTLFLATNLPPLPTAFSRAPRKTGLCQSVALLVGDFAGPSQLAANGKTPTISFSLLCIQELRF